MSKFLTEAPDDSFLLIKVMVIFDPNGAEKVTCGGYRGYRFYFGCHPP